MARLRPPIVEGLTETEAPPSRSPAAMLADLLGGSPGGSRARSTVRRGREVIASLEAWADEDPKMARRIAAAIELLEAGDDRGEPDEERRPDRFGGDLGSGLKTPV